MKPLKPVMAAILAASSLSFPLARTAFADGPATLSTTAAREKAVAHDKEFVARLISLVDANQQVRTDVGARLVEFILNRETGRQYLTTALLDDKVLIKGAVAQAQAWPDANKGEPAKVAALYYILGVDTGKTPAWAPAGFDDEFKPNAVWSTRLAAALSAEKWDKEKRVAQSGAVDGTTALLNDAAKWAKKILDDGRTKGEVHDSIVSNDTTAPIPPETAKRSTPLDSTGSGFGHDDLYVKGAEVADIYGPNEGYRTISMKVYSSRDADGNAINRIGIVDITKGDITNPTVPRFVDSSRPGTSEITLRDGGQKYEVTVGQDGSVTLKRPGAKDGAPGTLTTSRDGLMKDRNDQIMHSGTVTIAGQPYYVLGQGGAKGSFLFFSEAQLQQNPGGNAHPDLMGDVAKVIGDGSTAPITGKPDLGALPNGDPYHLEFDMTTRMWKVVPGKGDTDKKPDDKPGDQKPGDQKPGGQNQGGQNPGTQPDPATAKTLDEAVALAEADKPDKTQVWQEDASNAGLDDANRAQIRILSNTQDGVKHFNVFFDPALGVKDNHFEFLADNNGVRLLAVRGVLKKYIAVDYATGTQYYDIPNFAKYVQHVFDATLSYDSAGSYATSNGQMQNVKDLDIMEDILVSRMKVKSGDAVIATLRSRVAKHVKPGDDFILNGNLQTLYLGSGAMHMTIWPNEIGAGDTGTNDGMTGLRGPGTAVAITGGGAEKFSETMDMGSGRTATRVNGIGDAHSAIYSGIEDENVDGKLVPAKVDYVMIDYTKNKLPSRTTPIPVFGGKDRFTMPAGVQLQGLAGVELGGAPQFMMLYGSTAERGAIVAFRDVLPDAQGGQNVKNKAGNCGGPVLWWGGVTKTQAQSACAGDARVP